MEPTKRKCELCNHDDVDTYVVSSTIGGFSQNVCLVCIGMSAESKAFSKEYKSNYYDSFSDRYKDFQDTSIEIVTRNGQCFITRKEYVDSIKKED